MVSEALYNKLGGSLPPRIAALLPRSVTSTCAAMTRETMTNAALTDKAAAKHTDQVVVIQRDELPTI